MHQTLHHLKLGFLGCGHISQAVIRGLLLSNRLKPSHIAASNRSNGKLQRFAEETRIQTFTSNEQTVEFSDIIFLAAKPIDFPDLIDDIAQHILPSHIIVSLAAGITTDSLKKLFPSNRIARVIPNTPVSINQGVVGIFSTDTSACTTLDDLLSPLGTSIVTESEDQLDSLLVASSSGVGFVFELMIYFQDWLESHGFAPKEARQITAQTFLGAANMGLSLVEKRFEDLQQQVASKKGVTATGLESMRSYELDRLIRISLDQAQNRNEELARNLG